MCELRTRSPQTLRWTPNTDSPLPSFLIRTFSPVRGGLEDPAVAEPEGDMAGAVLAVVEEHEVTELEVVEPMSACQRSPAAAIPAAG